MIYEVKIAVFAMQNCLPKGLGLQRDTNIFTIEPKLPVLSCSGLGGGG